VERSDPPSEAPIVPKINWFERLIGWCIEQIVKAVWRVLVKPVLVAAFSPLLLVIGLARAKSPAGASRRSVNEEQNLAHNTDGDHAAGKSREIEEGRKDHG
jgi:hypothetical protein